MNFKPKDSKPSNRIVNAFLKSLIVAFLLSFTLLLVFALILYAFRGSQKILSIGIISIYIISTFACGYLCGHIIQKRKYLWGSLAGFFYFAILFLLSFFFPSAENQASLNTLTIFIICTASSTIGGMLS